MASPCADTNANVSLTMKYSQLNSNANGQIILPYLSSNTWGNAVIKVVWDGTNYLLRVAGLTDYQLCWRCNPNFRAVGLGISLDTSVNTFDVDINSPKQLLNIQPIIQGEL